MVTLTGPLDELLSAESVAAHADDWVCAVYTDAVPQTEPMRRLRESYPYCAMVQHQPEVRAEADERSYVQRLRNAVTDADRIDAFLEHVRAGQGPTVAERDLIGRSSTSVCAPRRSSRCVFIAWRSRASAPSARVRRSTSTRSPTMAIFLIAGRTGAGKSSILDAVCFGLYGGVPRYDGGEKRLRSDHCEPDDPSEVVVEFSTPTGRFRVTRSPEYLRRPSAAAA